MTSEVMVILFVTSPLAFLLLYLLKISHEAKHDGNRYMFFKIRDHLVLLVAEGHLKEDDFLFREYYKMTNQIINNTHHFTFKNLIKGLTQIDKTKLGKDKFIKKVKSELKKKGPEVEKVVSEFYRTIFKTLYRNSLIVRIVVMGVIPLMSTSIHLNNIMKTKKARFHGRYSEGVRLAMATKHASELLAT